MYACILRFLNKRTKYLQRLSDMGTLFISTQNYKSEQNSTQQAY
jgi:hypothetical protein